MIVPCWVESNVLAAGMVPVGTGDLIELQKMGVRAIITLTERPLTCGRGIAVADVKEYDLEVFHIPIPDQSPPAMATAREIITAIQIMRDKGRPVYVHCQAGSGRTGTALHLWRMSQGDSLTTAQIRIRSRMPTADFRVLSSAQQSWLFRLEQIRTAHSRNRIPSSKHHSQQESI